MRADPIWKVFPRRSHHCRSPLFLNIRFTWMVLILVVIATSVISAEKTETSTPQSSSSSSSSSVPLSSEQKSDLKVIHNGKSGDNNEKSKEVNAFFMESVQKSVRMEDRAPTNNSAMTDANRSRSSWEIRNKANRKYWEQTLKEIKNLATLPPTTSSGANSTNLNRWKVFATPRASTGETNGKDGAGKTSALRRFDGFANWEQKLQTWSEDLQEYLEKQSNTEYPMSTYGKPPSSSEKSSSSFSAEVANGISSHDKKSESSIAKEKKKALLSLPVIPETRKDGEDVLPHTDLSDKSKRVWVVTTASLPWMTGTAVNPILRSAYLLKGRKEAGGSVTLMLPWLERKEDQERVYGKDRCFDSQEEQEQFIRAWLKDSAKMPQASVDLDIRWYTAWQNKAENSVYSMGDITATISADEVDIMILEEPEHMNWYRAPGESWTDKFQHVVGIIHTNYFVYAQEQPAAFIRAPCMKQLCVWMCRSHCHRIVKLSGALQEFAPEKELIENVHGVRGAFLESGKIVRDQLLKQQSSGVEDPVFGPNADPSVYFIGKMLWSKGLGSLMELLKYAEETAGIKLKVDMYGGGPDKDAAQMKSDKLGLNFTYHGPIDHPELSFTHKVFINPSTSEVLCTTVSEALAMGKFVVLPSHPSNDFFAQFPNCLVYSTKEEFVGNLYYALTHSPEPLAEEYSYALSWEAATDRLESAACIPTKEAEIMADAGFEINLPPLFEDEQSKKLVKSTIQTSRERYRIFRSRLSQDINQSLVLPKGLKERLISELDKRLDADIDKVLESPSLQLQLSPAELDKRCLELYKTIAAGPGGDLMRIIGGGNEVGMQVLYMKRQARKRRGEFQSTLPVIDYFSEDDYDDTDENQRTASQWVRRTLRRNLPRVSNATSTTTVTTSARQTIATHAISQSKPTTSGSKSRETPKMSIMPQTHSYPNSREIFSLSSWTNPVISQLGSSGSSFSKLSTTPLRTPSFHHPRRSRSVTLLI